MATDLLQRSCVSDVTKLQKHHSVELLSNPLHQTSDVLQLHCTSELLTPNNSDLDQVSEVRGEVIQLHCTSELLTPNNSDLDQLSKVGGEVIQLHCTSELLPPIRAEFSPRKTCTENSQLRCSSENSPSKVQSDSSQNNLKLDEKNHLRSTSESTPNELCRRRCSFDLLQPSSLSELPLASRSQPGDVSHMSCASDVTQITCTSELQQKSSCALPVSSSVVSTYNGSSTKVIRGSLPSVKSLRVADQSRKGSDTLIKKRQNRSGTVTVLVIIGELR